MNPENSKESAAEQKTDTDKLATARNQRDQYSQKLAAAREELMALELDAPVSGTNGPLDGLPASPAIEQARARVKTWDEAISQLDKIVSSLDRKIATREVLETFDRLTGGLVQTSTEIGYYTALVGDLMVKAEAAAGELDSFIAETFSSADFKAYWGAGAGSIYQAIAGAEGKARVKALREAHGAGEFLKNRFASIRATLESELLRRH